VPATERSEQQEAPAVPKASTFIGSSVENAQGESLGTISDLMIDPIEGRITYAALSYGSVLGLGGKLFAVSWEDLELRPDGKTFVLNVSPETLETSPGFDKTNWPQQPDPSLSTAAGGAAGQSAPAQTTSSAQPNARPENTQQGEAMSGTIQEVNPQEQSFTLKTTTGPTVNLQAPADLLAGLQVGDVVEVKRSGTQAMEIHKKENLPQPNMDGKKWTQ
jgi:sporulation protein YlmC with PRC-barrel domain